MAILINLGLSIHTNTYILTHSIKIPKSNSTASISIITTADICCLFHVLYLNGMNINYCMLLVLVYSQFVHLFLKKEYLLTFLIISTIMAYVQVLGILLLCVFYYGLFKISRNRRTSFINIDDIVDKIIICILFFSFLLSFLLFFPFLFPCIFVTLSFFLLLLLFIFIFLLLFILFTFTLPLTLITLITLITVSCLKNKPLIKPITTAIITAIAKTVITEADNALMLTIDDNHVLQINQVLICSC